MVLGGVEWYKSVRSLESGIVWKLCRTSGLGRTDGTESMILVAINGEWRGELMRLYIHPILQSSHVIVDFEGRCIRALP